MRVRELIEALAKFDPEAHVVWETEDQGDVIVGGVEPNTMIVGDDGRGECFDRPHTLKRYPDAKRVPCVVLIGDGIDLVDL